jgi:hypothetical protein
MSERDSNARRQALDAHPIPDARSLPLVLMIMELVCVGYAIDCHIKSTRFRQPVLPGSNICNPFFNAGHRDATDRQSERQGATSNSVSLSQHLILP